MQSTLEVDTISKSGSSTMDALYYLTKAQAALEEENLFLAMESMIKAHNLEPDEVQIIAAILEIQLKLGHCKQMLPNIDLLINLQPENISWPINRLFALTGCEAFEEVVEESLLLLKLYPKNTQILALLASAYYELNNYSDGLDVVNGLIELNSGASEPFLIRGLIYRSMGKMEHARTDLFKAESLGEKTAGLFNALGLWHSDMFQHEIALDYFCKSLSVESGLKVADKIALNASLSAMCLGDFDKAWQFYAYRKKSSGIMDESKYVAWQGENLSGKHLVVRREQGLGDELRLSSVIAEVAEEAKLITLECDPRLVGLYQRSFPCNVRSVGVQVHGNGYAEVDCAAHIGDLSMYKRRSLDDFPEHYGYFQPDPKRVDYWTDYLQGLGGKLNIGVIWKSGLTEGMRSTLYSNIEDWLPVFSIEGINFVNLYYGDSEEELKWVEAQIGVKVHVPKGIDLKNDIDDLSALIASLDLAVGPHTAPIDLAMAVKGASAWVLPFTNISSRHSFYFGQAYYPWAPATKPVFGDGFQRTMAAVAEELAHIVQTTDPKLTLAELSKVMYACYGTS